VVRNKTNATVGKPPRSSRPNPPRDRTGTKLLHLAASPRTFASEHRGLGLTTEAPQKSEKLSLAGRTHATDFQSHSGQGAVTGPPSVGQAVIVGHFVRFLLREHSVAIAEPHPSPLPTNNSARPVTDPCFSSAVPAGEFAGLTGGGRYRQTRRRSQRSRAALCRRNGVMLYRRQSHHRPSRGPEPRHFRFEAGFYPTAKRK